MELNFENGAVLLLIAAVVAMLTRRLRLPYSVGLVAAGFGLAILPFAPRVNFTKEFIFTALLPPLLFEAAYHIHWRELRRNALVISVLATVGVLLSAGVTTLGMHYAAHWEWLSALIFGVLIAATDPVSVIATFKEAGVKGRLLLLVESESLFNDGTAAVAFGVAVALSSGQHLAPLEIAASVLITIGGGTLLGAAVAGGALLLAGRTEDHLVEITLTTIAAYGSFLVAENFGVSGVLATITAGLIFGNLRSSGAISARGQEAVEAFWECAKLTRTSLRSGSPRASPSSSSRWAARWRFIPAVFCLHDPRWQSAGQISTFCFGADCAGRWHWLSRWDSRPTCQNARRSLRSALPSWPFPFLFRA